MNFRNTIYCVLLSLVCTYAPTHGMDLTFFTNLLYYTNTNAKVLSKSEFTLASKQISGYQSNIETNLKKLTQLDSNEIEAKKSSNKTLIRNAKIAKENTLETVQSNLSDLIEYIKTTDHTIKNINNFHRLAITNKIINDIDEQYIHYSLENQKQHMLLINNICDTTLCHLNPDKQATELKESSITYEQCNTKNKENNFLQNPSAQIDYISKLNWDDNLKATVIQLLWSEAHYQVILHTKKRNNPEITLYSKNRAIFAEALATMNKRIPIFPQIQDDGDNMSEATIQIPEFIMLIDKIPTQLDNASCYEPLLNLITNHIDTLNIIKEQNIRKARKNKIEKEKKIKEEIIKKITTKIDKIKKNITQKQKDAQTITIEEWQKYKNALQDHYLAIKNDYTNENYPKKEALCIEIKTTEKEINRAIETEKAKAIKYQTIELAKKIRTLKEKGLKALLQELIDYKNLLEQSMPYLKGKFREEQTENIIYLTQEISELEKEKIEQERLELEKKIEINKIKIEKEKLEQEKIEKEEIDKLIELYTSRKDSNYDAATEILFQDYTTIQNDFNKLKSYENKLKSNPQNNQKQLLKDLSAAIKNTDKTEENFTNNITERRALIVSYNKTLSWTAALRPLIYKTNNIINLLPKKTIPSSDNSLYKEIIETLQAYLTKTCETMPKHLVEHCENLTLWHNTLLRLSQNNDQNNIVAPLLEIIQSTMKKIITEWTSYQIVTTDESFLIKNKKAWWARINEILYINEKNLFLKESAEDAKSMIDNPSPELLKIKNANDTLHNIRDVILTRYDQDDISPAALIHYDLNTLNNDLDTLKKNQKEIKYNFDLEKYYAQSIAHLTDIQTKLQIVIETIKAYNNFLSSNNHALKCINNTCNHINNLIEFLPKKELTNLNNPLYQNLIKTLLSHINLIEHCSDLNITNIFQLEKLITTLKFYENIDSENINKAIETVKKNIMQPITSKPLLNTTTEPHNKQGPNQSSNQVKTDTRSIDLDIKQNTINTQPIKGAKQSTLWTIVTLPWTAIKYFFSLFAFWTW